MNPFSFLKFFMSFEIPARAPLSVNGFGWGSERARDEVERLLVNFVLLPETPQVFGTWLELVTTHGVVGKQVHDARLAAATLAHNLDFLLTPKR